MKGRENIPEAVEKIRSPMGILHVCSDKVLLERFLVQNSQWGSHPVRKERHLDVISTG